MTAKTNTARRAQRRSSTMHITWRDITATVRHTRDYLIDGQDHIEVTVKAPSGAVLPITETGYRSHFLAATEVIAAGGPVRYVLAWLDREAQTKRWQKAEFRWRQLHVFG